MWRKRGEMLSCVRDELAPSDVLAALDVSPIIRGKCGFINYNLYQPINRSDQSASQCLEIRSTPGMHHFFLLLLYCYVAESELTVTLRKSRLDLY